MLEQALETTNKGLQVNDYTLYAKSVLKGRFREEVNVDIWIKKGDNETNLMFLKVFYGRPPYYKPWVEFFNIKEHVKIGNKTIDYFGSAFEDGLLQFFAQYIGPGENIFVEYDNDRETKKQLEVGFPSPVTRLGYKLFNLGFTWFKDWYFPEGFMEGDQKLQGEKPLNEESKAHHLEEISSHVKNFLERTTEGSADWYMNGALQRAKRILEMLKS